MPFYDTLLGPTFASASSVDISGMRKRGTVALDLGKKLPFDLTLTYMRELKSGYRGERGRSHLQRHQPRDRGAEPR